jgi:uncharacterized protein
MLEGARILDFIGQPFSFEDAKEIIQKFDNEGYGLFIGTDSQVYKNKISIVTCLCLHKQGSSGKIFYVKDTVPRKKYNTLRSRMLLEAYRSIEAAMELEGLIKNKITIHLDVGGTSKSKSSEYHRELSGLVEAQGYNCEIKPDAWASSAVADKVAKW